MNNNYKVSLQGLDKNTNAVTGEFGLIDVGLLSIEEINTLLQKVLQLKVEEKQLKNKKFCPPNITVEYKPGEFLNFWLNGSVLFCNETKSSIDSANAIKLIIEKASQPQPVNKKPLIRLWLVFVLAFIASYTGFALAYVKFNYPNQPNPYIIGGITFGMLLVFHVFYKIVKK